MNNNVVKKCIEELKKQSPKIDYVLGMLEALVEMQDVSTFSYSMPPTISSTIGSRFPQGSVGESLNPPKTNEGELLDAKARAALDKTKELVAKSMK